jgi:Protein of unknown function (DUF3499)
MGYRYAQRVAWIDDLGRERDPHAYDLCERHAARMSVPAGWELDDRRAGAAERVSPRLAG